MRFVGCLMVGAALLSPVTPAYLLSQESVESTLPEVQERGPYHQGMDLKSDGEWEGALKLWEEASDFFTAPPDPRIAFAYLETAIENGNEERYGLASEMLLWGLSGPEYPPHLSGPILQELERILPLMEDEDAEQWAALRDSSTQKIARELKHFWIEEDPSPASVLNERLIEHWQRVLYARSQFTYSLDSPYGTDDRGVIWVKYGPPGREKSGMLGASETELKIRIPLDAQAREAIRRYDTNPQYEVWVYDDLNNQGFTYFLFGNEGGQGRFRLVDGVRDLIPLSSRSQGTSRYTPGGVPAAYYLELFYYETLSDVGGFFGRRFAELDELWNRYTSRTNREGGNLVSPSENTLRSYSQRYQLRDRADPENPPLDASLSSFDSRAQDEMVTQMVRLLRDNEPRLFILVASASRLDVPDRSGLRRQRIVAPGSGLRHTLIVRDEDFSEVGRLTERISSEEGDLSIFQLRHPRLPMHLTITGETLLDEDYAAAGSVDLGFGEQGGAEGEENRALPARAHIEPLPPLSTDTAHLEVSDLTLGVRIPEGMDGSRLPFPLLPASRIWWIDSLRVYLEVYHLALDGAGAGRFRADFTVEALRNDGSVDESRSPVTLSVQLETEGPMFGAPFDIALRDQELGHYRVNVTVTDLIRGETLSRSATLELIG
ncbi:MAG: GWxTD domain-containing protein [Gemmatimonadetes bacterium]|nr:GWxTD domain-containing protein [Gemmatimonadota bacterium]